MTTHKVPLPPHCFFSFRQMASKLTRWLFATKTDIIYCIRKKKKLSYFQKKKKVMLPIVSFDSFSRPNSKEKISEKLHLRVVEWCGACRVLFVGAECKYSCASLTQIKPNKSPWVVNTKWSGKLGVTLLIWWMLTANTDDFFSK